MVELTFEHARGDQTEAESQGLTEPVRAAHSRTSYRPAEHPISGDAVSLDNELRQIAAAKNDLRAFAPIYERYVDLVYRCSLRRLGEPELAADATGTAFALALSALPSFSPNRRASGSAFRSWLMKSPVMWSSISFVASKSRRRSTLEVHPHSAIPNRRRRSVQSRRTNVFVLKAPSPSFPKHSVRSSSCVASA